jgi:multidrug efflux pump subunit AcrB
MAIIAIIGIVSYSNIKSSFFPILDSRFITIQLIYPGASPEEIEEGVVQRIEENIQGLSGIERVTSVSSENAAAITIEVLKGFNTSNVLEDVKNAVNGLVGLPVSLETPIVALRENINFTISYAISQDNIDLKSLKEYARTIEEDLLRNEGISKVELIGFPREEIEIAINELTVREYGLTLDRVAQIIRASNIDISGGSLKTDKEELLIKSRNKNFYAKDLENLVIQSSPAGGVVRLKDIAQIKDQWEDNPNKIYINGAPAVKISVSSTDNEDLMGNAAYVKTYFDEFKLRNPDITVTLVKDQSETLTERRDLLVRNGRTGIILVLILLSLFLNIRVAFWVAVGLPISFLGMFGIALYYGITINVISLFGMIIVIGILVDDAIVISENIFSHYERGKSATKSALDGTLEVLPAVLSAVITTMVAFGFFFLVDGRAGDFFSELSFIVIATLLVSLVEALIILPSHIAHSKALKNGLKKNKLEQFTDKILYVLRDKFYAPILRFSLKHKFFVVTIFIASFLLTIGGIKGNIIRFTFFPFIERNEIPITLSLTEGTNETITEDVLENIEAAVWKTNKRLKKGNDIIVNIERKLGPKRNEGSLNVVLVSSEFRDYNSVEIASEFRKEVGIIPEAEKLTFGNTSAFGKPISITLLSDNVNELNEVVYEVKNALKELPELQDVVENIQEGKREIQLKLKPKAYILGLTEGDILNQIRQGYFGIEAQRIQRGRDEVIVWVRYDDQQRSNYTDFLATRIRTLTGAEIPLHELAEYKVEKGISDINHLDGKRQVTIEAELTDNTVSAPVILAGIKSELMPEILSKYQNTTAVYEGQNREAEKTQKSSRTALPLVLITIILIITFTFRSLGQAIIILFLLVPFSFVGVAWGHVIHGQQLSILSFLGVVALIGIIVNDSLVLVGKMNQFLKEGMSFNEAVYQAGYVRFRAIFLTSLTTIAGLAPLILERSFQAQFLIPMAISVAYGIGIATVLTLILLPSFLMTWNNMRRGILWLWNGGVMPSAEEIEPAVKEKEYENE